MTTVTLSAHARWGYAAACACATCAYTYGWYAISCVRITRFYMLLGWLVQIQSLCARSRSPKVPCIRLLVYFVSQSAQHIDKLHLLILHLYFNLHRRRQYLWRDFLSVWCWCSDCHIHQCCSYSGTVVFSRRLCGETVAEEIKTL